MSNTKKIVERNMAAFNAQDIETLLGNQCPDVEFVLPGGVTFRGRDQMKQYVQASWSAFPDGKLTRVGQILTESGAATEAVFTGTHTGLLATPSGSIPPTGKKFALRQVFLHRIEDEMIASEHVYLDQLEFLTQIGLAGAPVT